MAITVTQLNLHLDNLSRLYARLLSIDGSSNYGVGALGASNLGAKAASDLSAGVLATADSPQITGARSLAFQAANLVSSIDAVKIATHRGFLGELERLVQALGLTGVTSLAAYLEYYNWGSGGTNTVLQCPFFRDIYYRWKGVYPSFGHIYFEIKQGGSFLGTSYANGLGKLTVGTGFTDGAAVDETKYCGGVPYVNVSGFAGSSGTVTVTGTQYNPATRTFTTGKTWTATVSANGLVALTPGTADANSLITNVSNISVGAGPTAPTIIYAEALRPQTVGRLDVPF